MINVLPLVGFPQTKPNGETQWRDEIDELTGPDYREPPADQAERNQT